MPSAKIRCNFDEIKQVIGTFKNQNRDLTQLVKRIRTSKENLAGGRWIGKGATQFFSEMDNFILPSLNHLVQAVQGILDVADDRQIRRLVLVYLGGVDVHVDNGASGAKLVHLAGHTVVKPHAKSQQ